MSVQLFPTSTVLPGLDIKIDRKVMWDTIVQENVSGKETRIARRQFPRRMFGLQFNFLRSSTAAGFSPAVNELATLEGFFNNRQGMFDSFLWPDPDDNTVTNQGLGTGDSTTRSFQLARSFGSFVEPIFAYNTINSVLVGGSSVSSTTFTASSWGSTSPGVITFSTYAPSTSQTVAASFTFYWPVRFTIDEMDFNRFVNLIYENKKLEFETIL